MSDPESDPELTQLLTDLTRTLRELEQEVEPPQRRGPRLPTPSELSRFTSEVAIPGLILLLRTNIEALQLLQRTIRLAEGRHSSPDGALTEARTRAEKVGRESLSQLDGALSELQSALDSRPENNQASELLSRARDLREQVQDELQDSGEREIDDGDDIMGEDSQTDAVSIDIESELQSLKDNVEDVEDDDDDSPPDRTPSGDGGGGDDGSLGGDGEDTGGGPNES